MYSYCSYFEYSHISAVGTAFIHFQYNTRSISVFHDFILRCAAVVLTVSILVHVHMFICVCTYSSTYPVVYIPGSYIIALLFTRAQYFFHFR